jgi:hypothetical protein
MSGRLDLSKFNAFLDVLEGIPVEAWQEAVHDAIIRDMRAQEGSIPIDSGALRRSLLNRRDRAHVYTVTPYGQITYGSRLAQAFYQRDKIPSPRPQPIAQAYADAITDWLQAQSTR